MSDTVESRIISHHVGARGFGVPFTCPKTFDDDIVQVLYEADAECAEQMRSENENQNRFVLPYCIGGENKRETFKVTANPFGSSLYAPNEYYKYFYGEVYPGDDVYDAIFGEWCRTESEVEVDVVSLDSLFEEGRVPIDSPPDFLSLDTQGSEGDIIRGAEKTISQGVLGLATEIEFHSIYEGQPLFDEILRRADALGFHFAGFLHISDEISPFRAPLGLRGRSFLAFGDALFLRRPESLKDIAVNELHHYVMAEKLAFISIVFGFVEFGIDAHDFAGTILPNDRIPDYVQAREYHKFLRSFRHLSRKMDQVYLNTRLVSEASQPLEFQADAYANSRLVNWIRRTKSTIAQEYEIFRRPISDFIDISPRFTIREPFSHPKRFIMRVMARTFRFLDRWIDPISLKSPFHRHATLVEQLLDKYQFYWLQNLMRMRRLRTIRTVQSKPHAYTVTPGLEDD